MSPALLEREFVLIDQNSGEFAHAGCAPAGKGLPVGIADTRRSRNIRLSSLSCSSFFRSRSRSLRDWCIERSFFLSYLEEPVGCLFKAVGLYCAFKGKRYIIEQPPSTDTLESRHRADGASASYRVFGEPPRAREGGYRGVAGKTSGRCFPAQAALFPAAVR